MMMITAHQMYITAAKSHLTEAEKVRDAIEHRIQRAAEAGLTNTMVSVVIDNHVPSDETRRQINVWLEDAGFTIYESVDHHPGSFDVNWSVGPKNAR